ncbi:MAG: SufE family protein [Planctomycetota bacterium]|jgi:cysteine desulfuration protein SufE
MKINAIQDRIIDEFCRLDGWFDKYEYLVKAGQYLPSQDKHLRIERNQIHGCQSKVWLRAERKDDKVYFTADSDALITKGILALLLRVLSGQPRRDIATCELYFIEQTGLASNLSPTRANGLASIVKRMKETNEE